MHQLFYALATYLLLPSQAVFPPQQLPLTFSHAKHLAKKIRCDFCHDKAASSRKAGDVLTPNEEVCATCHEIDRKAPDKGMPCSKCHPGFQADRPVPRMVVPTANLTFDHKAHLDKGVPCARCHGDLSQVDLATEAHLPKMDLCLGCHDSRRAPLHGPSRCSTCHPTKADGTLKTAFPTGTLVPSGSLRGDGHGLDFRTNHKAVARDDEGYCLQCHRRDECQACHNGVVKPFDFHGNDYISIHAVEARRNQPDCSSCHRQQSFCLGCHERVGVVDIRTGQQSGFRPIGAASFHPAGWAAPAAAGQPNHHAWQAQRQLKQCVSCHRQETCLQCHATSGGAGAAGKMQVSPHPGHWRGSERCFALAARNARMCLQCHAAGDQDLSCK